ncbi:MAG: hypothetical protein HND47_16535 [Chloroflexi bacterium]|nr:hypothetical protein [Chloroflexota bacterium]
MKPTLKEPVPGFDGPQAPLEAMFLDEFLQSKGFSSIKDLYKLPEDEAKKLLMEACRYASLKLAEIESRARFKKEIHIPD